METSRRLRRSSEKIEALNYFLEAEQARSGAMGIAIGTLDGLPMSGVGLAPELLAAAGALKAFGLSDHEAVRSKFPFERFFLSVVTPPDGESVLITSLEAACTEGLEAAVVRILS